MVNFPGRSGRRRRVLNEEVLSSSHTARQLTAADSAASHAPRYSEAAGVENHPQITDFVPRKYRTIVMLLLTGVSTAVTLGALHYFADTLAKFAGTTDIRPFDLSAPNSISGWITSVILMVASAFCLLVYLIRRHKINDIRGCYRIWLAASLACVVLSFNTITGMHTVLASSLTHFTGWTALRDGAAWWLLVAGLPLAWIALRALIDVKECRLAGVLMIAAIACHTAATASFVGWLPAVGSEHEAMVTGLATFLGHWFAFAAVVSYARFVVLDAQGLITVRRTTTKKKAAEKPKQVREMKAAAEKPTILSVTGYSRPKLAETPATTDKWVDGSRPERESYDDSDEDDDDDSSGVRKLSKADRKRLRKLKAQNRAA
jgi:hypothetical protein